MMRRLNSLIVFAAVAAALVCAGCRSKAGAPAAERGKAGPVIVTHTPEIQPRRDFYDDERLPDFPHPTEEEKAVAKGLALLKEGRFDAACAAYGRNSWEWERDLRQLAKEAGENSRTAQALALYDRLLGSRYCILWRELCSGWIEVDAEYLAFVRKAPPRELDEAAAQDLAAGEFYDRLKPLIDARRFDESAERREVYAVAEEYIVRFPRARLGSTAMLAAFHAATAEEPAAGESTCAATIRKIDGLLDRMKAAGMSRYRLNTVLQEFVSWQVQKELKDPVLLVRARKASEEIAREGDPQHRAEWFLSAADYALQTREENGDLARRLFAETLAVAPGSAWALPAWDGIVRSHTEIEGLDAGLAALREVEKKAPPSELWSAKLDLADAFRDAKRADEAVALLEEVVHAQPKTLPAARAFRRIAAIRKDAKNEPGMLAALEGAADCLPPDTPLDIVAGCQRSFVYEDLADYHVAKKNWAEALKWSKAWKVQTGCANCDDSDRRTRRGYIALAEAALGRADDALKSMERVRYDRLAKAATMLVDTFRARGALDELQPKLEAAAKSDKPDGARIALRYVGLLRLADAKDVAGLWKTLDLKDVPYDESEWLKEEVPVLAGGLGDTAKPFLLERLSGGPHKDEALYALARMKAPEALSILLERAKDPKRDYDLDRTLSALASFDTDEVWSLIEKCADSDGFSRRDAANSVLREHGRAR